MTITRVCPDCHRQHGDASSRDGCDGESCGTLTICCPACHQERVRRISRQAVEKNVCLAKKW